MERIVSMRKWCLPDDADYLQRLENPPSLADGLSRQNEMDLRYACCDFIQCCVILLKLPQRAAGTAQILFHRYFTLKSFVKAGSRFSYEHILMACLLLASKLEDAPRKCRDVINVFFRLKQLKDCEGPSSRNSHNFKRVQLDDQYVVLKHVLQKVERKLLNVLGFVVNIDHPHRYVYGYIHYLGLTEKVAFLQKSWNYANDSFRSTVYLRYRFEAVACACVHLASTAIDYPVILPQDPAWFELFDVSLEEILAISDILRKIYEKAEIPQLNFLSEQLVKLNNKIVPLAMREQDGAGSSEILISIIKQEPAEREVLSQEEMQNRVGSAEIPMSISQEPVEQELLPVKEVLLESESAKEVIPCAVNDMQKIKKELPSLDDEKQVEQVLCSTFATRQNSLIIEPVVVKREMLKKASQNYYLVGNESLIGMDSALGISKVQFCPDPAARLLVASTWDGFVKAFRVASLEEVSNVCNYFHENPVLCCTFAGSSKIVTGMLDGLVKLYDIESGYEGVIGGHLDCVRCVEFSQPDNLAVTGGWDSVVKMWDCRLEMVHRDVGQLQCSDRVYALDVSGNRAVIATKDRQVMIYDFRNTSLPLQIRPSPLKYQTRAIKIMPSGQAFAVSSIEGRVAISYFDEDPAFQQNNCEFECHRIKTEKEELIYPVNALAIHPFGTFATGGSDGRVSMWDPFSQKALCQFRKFPTSIASLSFSPNGEILAIATTYLFEDANQPDVVPESRLILRRISDIEARPRKR